MKIILKDEKLHEENEVLRETSTRPGFGEKCGEP
jgi:hypothetical protein